MVSYLYAFLCYLWYDYDEGKNCGINVEIDNVIMAIERGTYVKIENLVVRTIPVIETENGFRVQ